VAWLLASACLLHHLTHWLGAAAPSWLHLLASTPVHASLAALALLGEFPCVAAGWCTILSAHGNHALARCSVQCSSGGAWLTAC
jgi:hypothetical protein